MYMKRQFKSLRLILGDQLNAQHSWFDSVDNSVIYIIAELHQETDYTTHHVQKICAFFSAMASFADELKKKGHVIQYLTLDDTAQFADLPSLLQAKIAEFEVNSFEYQLPDEYRLRSQLSDFTDALSINSNVYETEHFYITDKSLKTHFKKGKSHRLESFYRKMRKQFNLLMDGDKPLDGQWNFDASNRHKLKKADLTHVPEPLLFANDVSVILTRLENHKIKTIGKADKNLLWAVTQDQANQLLFYFCQYCLPLFGKFQDAMTGKLSCFDQDSGWSLYHSRLGFALNSKILTPKTVVDTAITYFHQSNGEISLAQIEGFIRQIVGWREFVRGIYWANMPEYGNLNHLNADNSLPEWFWTGNTKMNCMHHAIKQSLDFSYAHHIQRLMVIGNFCLISGISPDEVDNWYLGIYIDAIEWVEMPNARGMSQFADGGIVGSKAYAASGNYINKMSDYCGDCQYNVTETVGDNACPLNALYWHFMDSHEVAFSKNPRTNMVYSSWRKKDIVLKNQVLNQAEKWLKNTNSL